MTRVAVATHAEVRTLLRQPYYLTLWTFLQLQELERIDAFAERSRQLNAAGLLAIAFHEPKKLADEYHRLKSDMGMVPTTEQLEANVADVIAAVRAIDEGRLKTTVIGAPEAPDGH